MVEDVVSDMPLNLDLHHCAERVQDPRSNGLERTLGCCHPRDTMVCQLPGHGVPAGGVTAPRAIHSSQAQHTPRKSTPVDPLQDVLP
eukprot:6472007-Amphidinium_carterae.2